MALSGVPGAPRPLDLAAMEERLRRFDAEREATNTYLKSHFPDLADLLKEGAAPPQVAGLRTTKEDGAAPVQQPVGLPQEDKYEGVPRNYHLRQDAMHRALAEGSEGCELPAVGRPAQRKLRSLADALEEANSAADKNVMSMLAEGFAENDLIDHLRDAGAKASATSFERKFQDTEHLFQTQKNESRYLAERDALNAAVEKRDAEERLKRDDDLRRDREQADRARRDAEDASQRRRELDAANTRRDQERRDAEYRDQQRRLEEDRLRSGRD
jgi:hypothetical protein